MGTKESVYKTKTSSFSWMRDKHHLISSYPASAENVRATAKYAFQNQQKESGMYMSIYVYMCVRVSKDKKNWPAAGHTSGGKR